MAMGKRSEQSQQALWVSDDGPIMGPSNIVEAKPPSKTHGNIIWS